MIAATSSDATTIGEWFSRRDPAPPRALHSHLQTLLGDRASAPVRELPEVCLEVAEESLRQLLADGADSRESALTLLSIDALVTYAFEAAAGNAVRMEQRAALAMARISALAEGRLEVHAL